MIKAVLFDLDGTLIPMDQELFVKDYMKRLAGTMALHGYDPKRMVEALWKGTAASMMNTGEKTNEEAFWQVARALLGDRVMEDMPLFERFYETEFDKVKEVCGFDPQAAETVRFCKNTGLRVILATQPIFPAAATNRRIRWAGLAPEEFELVTTYENSRFAKPALQYYEEILQKCGLNGEDCLMVGNDTHDDLPAAKLGMKFFLLTHSLINEAGLDISQYPNGGFDDLQSYISALQQEA